MAAWRLGCEKMENEKKKRKWRENEEMEEKWIKNEEMEGDLLSTFEFADLIFFFHDIIVKNVLK